MISIQSHWQHGTPVHKKKNWLFRGYRGWNPTQLYGDYNTSHSINKDPYKTTTISWRKSPVVSFFSCFSWTVSFSATRHPIAFASDLKELQSRYRWRHRTVPPWRLGGHDGSMGRTVYCTYEFTIKINHENVGKYTIPMDPMGNGKTNTVFPIFHTKCIGSKKFLNLFFVLVSWVVQRACVISIHIED